MYDVNGNALISTEIVESALKKYLEILDNRVLEPEEINVEECLSRILYDDVVAKTDLPAYSKALVDGFAVRANDISSADAKSPVTLKMIGDISVSDQHKHSLGTKETVKISTGALLPENADSIVLQEDAVEDGKSVKILRSIIMGSNVAKSGEDILSAEIFIRKNRKIRPQDIGGIIGLGIKKIKVYKKPVVSIIPTGSELVPIDTEPQPGQIIASNGYMLKAAIEQLGGIGRVLGIVKDDLKSLKKSVEKALASSDIVLISGGSSTGTRDFTLKAVESFENSQLVCHGIAMRPGKQTLLAYINGIPVIGLPGHPVSSMTSFLTFAKPVLIQLGGNPRSFWQEKKDNIVLDAILARDVESPKGIEDYVRVRLKQNDNGKITAYPYAGKSSFLSTLVKAHGIIKLAPECSKLYEGDRVQVMLF